MTHITATAEHAKSPRALLDPVRDYLGAPRCAVLSSLGGGGAPHQAVVHYLLGLDHILVNGRPDRRWVSNLRRDGRVSLLVHDAEAPLHWVGLRGRVELVADDRSAVEDAMTMARRYGEDPAEYRKLQRVSFKIVPSQVFEYGASSEASLSPTGDGR